MHLADCLTRVKINRAWLGSRCCRTFHRYCCHRCQGRFSCFRCGLSCCSTSNVCFSFVISCRQSRPVIIGIVSGLICLVCCFQSFQRCVLCRCDLLRRINNTCKQLILCLTDHLKVKGDRTVLRNILWNLIFYEIVVAICCFL